MLLGSEQQELQKGKLPVGRKAYHISPCKSLWRLLQKVKQRAKSRAQRGASTGLGSVPRTTKTYKQTRPKKLRKGKENKRSIELHDPRIILLVIHSKETILPLVICLKKPWKEVFKNMYTTWKLIGVLFACQKAKTAQMPISGRMNKQIGAHPYNGRWHVHRKGNEVLLHDATWMDSEDSC